MKLGFHISLSGIVTFANASALRDVAALVPGDRLLVETDSPYLAPVPMRGKRCEPAYVSHTLTALAALRGVSLEQLDTQTSVNACELFNLQLPLETC